MSHVSTWMGDRLGIHGAVDILDFENTEKPFFWPLDIGAEARLTLPCPKSLSKKFWGLNIFCH